MIFEISICIGRVMDVKDDLPKFKGSTRNDLWTGS
jgi:hypothetical protein